MQSVVTRTISGQDLMECVTEIFLWNKVPNHDLLLSSLGLMAKLLRVGTWSVLFTPILPEPREYAAQSKYSVKFTERMNRNS